MKNSLILLMAGNGSRCGLEINKVLYRINQVPLFIYSLEKFNQVGFDEYILVVSENDYDIVTEYIENTSYNVKIVLGGQSRCESVRNAIKHVSGDYVFIHDAARPLIHIDDLVGTTFKDERFSNKDKVKMSKILSHLSSSHLCQIMACTTHNQWRHRCLSRQG